MKVINKKLFPLKPAVPFALGQGQNALYPRFMRPACASFYSGIR